MCCTSNINICMYYAIVWENILSDNWSDASLFGQHHNSLGVTRISSYVINQCYITKGESAGVANMIVYRDYD